MAGELLEDILGHLGVEKTYTANADVLVPNLSGLNLADATSALQKNSLTLRTVGDGGTVTGQIRRRGHPSRRKPGGALHGRGGAHRPGAGAQRHRPYRRAGQAEAG